MVSSETDSDIRGSQPPESPDRNCNPADREGTVAARSPANDPERDRLLARAGRVAQVGATLAGVSMSVGVNRIAGGADVDARIARAIKEALGRAKGPLMKAAQMAATIPDALPPELAKELGSLQANAPPMGWSFVRRRMRAELGADWESRFASFSQEAVHAASLGQVHKAVLHDGRTVAAKLQYPDMSSAVEADLAQIETVLGLVKRLDGSIDSSEAVKELGDRLREELDYRREARAMRLYADLLKSRPDIAIPEPVDALCTPRLLTMSWLDGEPVTRFKSADQAVRNAIAERLFAAWWVPMTRAGVIHGDPHLGNYAVTGGGEGLNLMDFGCIRIFPVRFVEGVVRLYRALLNDDFDAQVEAYELWGFRGLKRELIETLSLWARFIYAPLLDDRVRTVADGISPGEYGRKEAMRVRGLLKQHGPVTVPREFVFMDRAAIGLGSAYIHLSAELNFHRLFEASIDGFDPVELHARQTEAIASAGL